MTILGPSNYAHPAESWLAQCSQFSTGDVHTTYSTLTRLQLDLLRRSIQDFSVEYNQSIQKCLHLPSQLEFHGAQTQVDKNEYVRITYDYPLAAAKAFSTLSEKDHFNFVYVSGEG
ncbi:hypothetical protein FB45DRAFT_875534 [Roridomyces roridus]|uniref:Uncharacterized protein n=1 Tax=Roridomyces roridus TaxID=1738132 RepID=A0AAD7FBL0_9AGAR|nr:hypothetical protein FB45DRAFT_875534 [Roridomyces roridus]